MDRKSFVFYKDWRDAIKDLPDEVRLEVYDCIMGYAFTGKVEGLKPMVSIAFNFIKPMIDRDTEKYMSIGERNKANGSKGGRPKKETQNNPTKPSGFSGNPKNLDNVNDNDNNNIPPIIPPLSGDTVATAPDASDEPAGKKEKTWREDYEIYLNLVREAYRAIRDDLELVNRQQTFHPGVDIMLSIEKACENFWATESGWKHKKKSRAKEIDMKMTLVNAIDKNRVFKSNETAEAKRYDNGDFLR